jgi:N-acetylglucosamine-6-phosphate deacetylase
VIVLRGGDLVLPTGVLAGASLLIEGPRVASVELRERGEPHGATVVDARGRFVVPGFIDVHVHGVDGSDTLDAGDPLARIAAALPRYGVTAFCPTSVACAPDALAALLGCVRAARASRPPGSARVLPAHLESNFINPDYRGAQPAECLRSPKTKGDFSESGGFSGEDILRAIEASRPYVGIVTLAPEIEGGLDLVRRLVGAGHRVSLGHSGADYETAGAAIDAGARHATHLFNRMPPLSHRAPGLAGAVLARHEVAAELICDGFHVHPAVAAMAIAAKGVGRVMAITDGTAASGLVSGSAASLGGRRIHVRERGAFLDDGTLAGSTLTMDAAFRTIVHAFGRSVADAAAMCSTTPARELGLNGFGVLAPDAVADIVVLDRDLRVERTFIDGCEVYARRVT